MSRRLRWAAAVAVLSTLELGCQSNESQAEGSGGSEAGGVIAAGDFSKFRDLQWIDTHVHLHSHARIEDYVTYESRFGMQKMVLLSPPRAAGLLSGGRPNENAEVLLAKAKHPDRFYVFGGLDLTPLVSGGQAALSADLANHDSAFALLGQPKPIQCGPALTHIDRLIAHTTQADEITCLEQIRAELVTACP